VFLELGADVISINDKPDGFNINQNCGSTDPNVLRQCVLDNCADLGVGLDGDGDRVILVDATGQVVNGDQLLYVIARDRLQRNVLHGGVVGTLMSNYALELAMCDMGIPFARSRVGDRYVLELLKERDWKIGGESSGHIVCLDKTTTGDGIVAALQVLAIMVKHNKSLSMLLTGLQLLPQSLINLRTEQASLLANHPTVLQSVDLLNAKLEGEGRVLLRASGTEPLLRVMVEGQVLSEVSAYAQELREEISKIEKQLGLCSMNHKESV
jgi:phosphoglucosamine mutase